MLELTGVVGSDSTTLLRVVDELGEVALDNEGDEGAEIPNVSNFLLCSDFCFFNSLSASSSALLCSLASAVKFGLPDRVDDDFIESFHDMH